MSSSTFAGVFSYLCWPMDVAARANPLFRDCRSTLLHDLICEEVPPHVMGVLTLTRLFPPSMVKVIISSAGGSPIRGMPGFLTLARYLASSSCPYCASTSN